MVMIIKCLSLHALVHIMSAKQTLQCGGDEVRRLTAGSGLLIEYRGVLFDSAADKRKITLEKYEESHLGVVYFALTVPGVFISSI